VDGKAVLEIGAVTENACKGHVEKRPEREDNPSIYAVDVLARIKFVNKTERKIFRSRLR